MLYSQTGTLLQPYVWCWIDRAHVIHAMHVKLIAHNIGSYMHILSQQRTLLSEVSAQAHHALIKVMMHIEQKLICSEAARLPRIGPKQPRR